MRPFAIVVTVRPGDEATLAAASALIEQLPRDVPLPLGKDVPHPLRGEGLGVGGTRETGSMSSPHPRPLPVEGRGEERNCRSLGASAFEVIHPIVNGERSGIGAALRDCNVDVNRVETRLRRKRLLVADMESTIIEQEMLDELADFIGARERIAAITERAMRGELDFEAALKERVAMLAGLDASVLDEVAERITLMPGAETLIRTMKANGAYCALVSGGFTVFTERIARQLGFDEHQANVLEIENGKLTGRVVEPILGREAKRLALLRLTAELGIDPRETISVGDGANDLAMLEAAGLGAAFRAKPKVCEAVAAMPNGAVVTHGDLTALLYLQGYAESDFSG